MWACALARSLTQNLKQANPLLGAAHVAGIGAGGLWHRVTGIEIGNEVDHWSPGQLSFKDYEARFASFVAAYKATGMPAQPRVRLCDPVARLKPVEGGG